MSLSSLRPVPPSLKRGKQEVVIDSLTRLARKLGPGAKLPTARQLAKALGITGATLTRCLERMEVQGIIRCRQGSGIYVEAGVMQKRVGLVFGENIFSPSASQFGALMLKHCAERAASQNERFSFFLDTPGSAGVMNGVPVPAHQDLADALRDEKLDGILLTIRNSSEQEKWLRSQGIPVVSAEATVDDHVAEWHNVIFDYQKLVDQGVERLHREGCRSIGFFGALCEHRRMFQTAAEKYKIECRDEWISCSSGMGDPRNGESHEPFGIRAAEDFLTACQWNPKSRKKSRLPDGLLIADDMMARGVLTTFRGRGVAVGTDLKICSHANKDSVVLAEWHSSIFTVLFDPEAMATGMFEMLEALMNGKPFPSPYLIGPVE